MEKRIQIEVVEPQAYQGMFALEQYLQKSQLSRSHKELIKIRASQINGCAFCIHMHTQDALRYGESAQRIFLLDAWREADVFTEEEKCLLQLTEEVTLIHQGGLSSESYNKAVELLGEHYLAQVIMAITTINAWNRIALSTHKPIAD